MQLRQLEQRKMGLLVSGGRQGRWLLAVVFEAQCELGDEILWSSGLRDKQSF
jgi:hypothetical protein